MKAKKTANKKTMETINILFCGTGGQGVLSAAEVCGWAAVLAGYHVKKSEVHGMAQRGGSVESHLRIGRKVHSPLIPLGRVDYLVSFNAGEHNRLKRFLKPKGVDLHEYYLHAEKTLEDKRYINTYLIGVLSRYIPIEEDIWKNAIAEAFQRKSPEENMRIFYKGRGDTL